MADDISIETIIVKNFRAIKEAKINFGKKTIIVGKNNIGKSSLIDVFSRISSPKLIDFNADLIRQIWESKDNMDYLKEERLKLVMSLSIIYKWSDLTIPYWNLLSDIADKGETQIEIFNYLPEDRLPKLSGLKSTKELPDLFECGARIGTPTDFKDGTTRTISFHEARKMIPQFRDPENTKVGELLIYPISAFRYVQTGENSNEQITADQFSSELMTALKDEKDTLEKIQQDVDENLKPKMSKLEDKLDSFAYPKVDGAPIKATLTIDEWLENPQLRIGQTFDDLPGFELPLSSQGLGYQNIYNIIARISNLFMKLSESQSGVPVTIVIEEPEAFTHPQLQHVFIQKIAKHIDKYAQDFDIHYQLVIISHSHEVAVSALDSLDFKLVIGRQHNSETRFLNWSELGGTSEEATQSRAKLKKLMLNYNAELLFSDKLIAYEGDGERLLLGSLSRAIKRQTRETTGDKVAWIPVGTHFEGYQCALADLLFDKILLITDNDYDKKNGYENPDMTKSTNQNMRYLLPLENGKLASVQNEGDIKYAGTNYPVLKKCWYLSKKNELVAYNPDLDKEKRRRISSSTAHFMIVSEGKSTEFDIWPRTLESALIFAAQSNFKLYKEAGLLREGVKEENVSNELNDIEGKLLKSGLRKADFALKSQDIIENEEFVLPEYLLEGLDWLVKADE